MSRHGPSASASILLHRQRADLDAATVLRPFLAGVRGWIARIGDCDPHRPMRRTGLDAVRNLGFEEVRPTLRELLGRDRDWLRRGRQRPAHRMVVSGAVGEDESVEAVVRLLGVTAGPGRALRPAAEGRDLGMGAGELRHRVRLLAGGGNLELAESLDRRHGEERRVDHRHAPLLAVRRGDHEPQAAHALLGIVGVRVRRAQIEAPDYGILTFGEHLSMRQLRSGAVRLEHSREANSLGVIAPVAKRRAIWPSEAVDKLLRRQALGREPSGRIGEGGGDEGDHAGNQRE